LGGQAKELIELGKGLWLTRAGSDLGRALDFGFREIVQCPALFGIVLFRVGSSLLLVGLSPRLTRLSLGLFGDLSLDGGPEDRSRRGERQRLECAEQVRTACVGEFGRSDDHWSPANTK
jgi:hypothetical protein